MVTRVLGFLFMVQAASRVRLAQYIPGLVQHDIYLEIQSLLDNDYLQSTYSGSKISIRHLFALYPRRILALTRLRHFDLIVVYAEVLPLFPAAFELSFFNIPYILDFDDAFFLKYRRIPKSLSFST